MPDITPDEFEDIDDYAAAVQAAAIADAARPDFTWAIAVTLQTTPDHDEYAIELQTAVTVPARSPRAVQRD